GIGECDRQSWTGHRGGRRREVGAVEGAEQLSAALIALESAASFGVELSCQRIPPGGRRVRRLLGGPHTARKHLLALAHTWRGGLCLCDREGEYGRDRQRGEHLPARGDQPALGLPARAALCRRRRVTRVE